MNKSNIPIVIYVSGIIIGALFLDIWDADINIKKGLMSLCWSTLLLIGLFYADKKKQ